MKTLTILFLSTAASLSALSMGNPAEPQIICDGFFISEDASYGAKVGYLGDRVADRKMKMSGNGHGRIDNMALSFDQGVVAFNYLDRVEFYGSAGSMNGELSNRPHSDNKRRQYQTHDGWTAGTGGRFLLAQWGKTVIGIDGKIQWGSPGMKWAAVDGTSKNTGGHLKYREWQASFAVSYTADWLTPYLGVKYSNVRAKVTDIPRAIYQHSRFKMINRDRFGIALGCTLSPGKKFDLFAEVQMIDEQALSFGGNLRF
jgi:hypothetical protein